MVRRKNAEETRCVCFDFSAGGAMIACEECEVWQHMDCVGLVDIPGSYFCELCRPLGHPYFRMISGQDRVSQPSSTRPKLKESEQKQEETLPAKKRMQVRIPTKELINDIPKKKRNTMASREAEQAFLLDKVN
jgi:hypothetical protein